MHDILKTCGDSFLHTQRQVSDVDFSTNEHASPELKMEGEPLPTNICM